MPKPKTDLEKEARVKELEKLSDRELLLRVMEKMGDERVSNKQLLRALIILEDRSRGTIIAPECVLSYDATWRN